MRRTLCLAFLIVLVIAPAPASESAAPTMKQLKAQIAQLKRDKAKAIRKRETAETFLYEARADLKQARKDLAASKAAEQQTADALAVAASERDAARVQLVAVQAQVANSAAGQVAVMTPDQLWGLLNAVFTAMPNQGICGYSRSFFSGSSLQSYNFDKYTPC